jgi:DNA-binding NarL/FixJ family response regulator
MRVAIADDSALFRTGLAGLLAAAGVEVVYQAATADEITAVLGKLSADVVMLDIRMPPTSTDEGIVAAMSIRRDFPGTAVLVLSTYAEPSYALDLLSTGDAAVGYLLKDRVGGVDDLVEALRRVARGETVVDPLVVQRLFARRQFDTVLAGLTQREQDILHLIAEGRSNAGIAQRLFLSPKTVEHHIARIFSHLRLDADGDDNRRVLATLTWLRGRGLRTE